MPTSTEGYARKTAAFRHGLNEARYTEGQNVAIKYRAADGHYDRLPDLASDLVRRHVAVIATAAMPVAVAAKQAIDTLPIVFEIGADPVGASLVARLNRPGGNITGIANLSNALVGKRIELIPAVVPNAEGLAVLLNPDN